MPGSPLNLVLPTLADSLSDIVSKLVTALGVVETDLEAQVTAGELSIDTNLSIGGNQLTNVAAVQLASGTTTTTAGMLYRDSLGELHIITADGDVQLTLNGAINVASLGTIGGDYGGVNLANVTYDDLSGEYRFMEDGSVWADLVCEDVVLHNSANAFYGRLNFAGTESYTLTLPAALPAANYLVQMSAAGALTATNTIDNHVTLAADKNVTLSGTGVVTAPDIRLTAGHIVNIGGSGGQTANSGTPPAYSGTTNQWTHGTASARITFNLPVTEGAQITAWKAHLSKASATGTVAAELYKYEMATGTRTQIGSTQSNSAAAPGNITLTETGLTETVAAGYVYMLQVIPSTVNGDQTFGVSVTCSRL